MADFREQSTDPSVKAASTAATATDLALVVGLSPNSPLPAGSATIGAANFNIANASAAVIMQNAVAVTGNGTNLPVTGYGTSVIQISGTFVASINFEASVDAGVTWTAISATQIGFGDIFSVVTTPGTFRLTTTGIDLIRARVTWTSGTSITVSGKSTNAINASKIVKLATGTNTIGAVRITDGTTLVKVTAAGEQVVTAVDVVPVAQSITAQDIVSATATGANGQGIITGIPTAGSANTLTISGDSSFAILIAGTWTGTLQFERSLDAGASYTVIGAFSAGTSFIVATATANGAFHGNASSATNIRVRSTAAWTGTASVKLLAGAGVGTITVGNPLRLFDRVSGVEHSIKAASTPAAATDTAFVVSLSPNSPVTLGTPTAFTLSSAATTNATSVKTTAGTAFQIVASNVGAAAAFLKLFNLATAPTVGTSVPVLTVPIPASGVVSVPFGALGMRFGTGIAFDITNLVADADATVIAAAQVKVMVSYL